MAKNRQEFISEGLSPEEVTAFEEYSQGGGAPAAGEMAPEPAEAPVESVESAAQAAQDTQQQPQTQQEQKMVDIRALQEARAAQRAAEQRAAQLEQQSREERARLDERLKIINDALAGKKTEEPKIPTKDEDVLGFYDHQFETVQGKFQSLEQKLAAMEKAEQDRIAAQNAIAQKQQAIAQVNAAYEQAKTRHPEVDEALTFTGAKLREEINNQLLNAGYAGDQLAAAAQQMFNEQVERMILQCPRDPDGAAEHIRRHARFWGWMPQQMQPQPAQQQFVQQQQPVQQVIQPTPQQRAEQQQRHMSLSGTQGGHPPATLTAEALAKMSDKEFFALMKTADGNKKFRSIMAGD